MLHNNNTCQEFLNHLISFVLYFIWCSWFLSCLYKFCVFLLPSRPPPRPGNPLIANNTATTQPLFLKPRKRSKQIKTNPKANRIWDVCLSPLPYATILLIFESSRQQQVTQPGSSNLKKKGQSKGKGKRGGLLLGRRRGNLKIILKRKAAAKNNPKNWGGGVPLHN